MAITVNGRGRSVLALGALVLVVGAGLMCAELVGGMTIAPYFGSNVFVWGSVISIFMAALSVGYVLGGTLANKGPRPGLLSALTALAGLLVVAAPVISRPVCELLLSIDLGPAFNSLRPLAAVAIIYFLPTMFFGMILPVAVRIASTTLSTVGSVVGRLYALNALGSVAGALGTMFLLAPFFGNRAILIGCGIAVVVAANAYVLLQRGTTPGEPGDTRTQPAESADEQKPVPGLRALVFTCGMVFMGLEIVGGAEIAPYFGSNIFVWGSVITLFLGALAIGYRLGGRLADRRPTMMTLATIVVAAGITTLLIPLMVPMVCNSLLGLSFAGRFSVAVQSLIASVALYLVPTMLFAMVAPFAVRLSTQDVDKVGGVAGKLYALSTLGSVAGVLLTTFVLISAIGKTHVLEAAGVLTVIVAAAAVLMRDRADDKQRRPIVVSVILVSVTILFACVPKPALVPLTVGEERIIGKIKTDDFAPWSVIESRYANSSDNTYHYLRRVLAERESPYHHIAVLEKAAITRDVIGGDEQFISALETTSGRKIRVNPEGSVRNKRDLRFDQYVESSFILDSTARKIRKPYKAGTTYSDLLHLPFLFPGKIEDVVIVGGGGGVVPMIFAQAYPQLSIDVVEIDPVVVDAAKEWFGLTPNEDLRVHVQDGRMFIHNSKKKYDLIILDAYTSGGRIPFHLTTKEFLSDVRDHLRPDGIVLMNVISAVSGPASKLFRSEYKTFRAVFGKERVYVFPKSKVVNHVAVNPRISTNVILLATGPSHPRRLSPRRIKEWADKAFNSNPKRMKMATLIGKEGYASHALSDKELKKVRQDDVPVLTDDYAPVDMMTVE